MTVTITRSGNISISSSVRYSSINGSAVSPNDFSALTGSISFAAGETSKSFTVPITNDIDLEGNETFSLVLSGPLNAQLGGPASTVITIVDNDRRRGSSRPRGVLSPKAVLE